MGTCYRADPPFTFRHYFTPRVALLSESPIRLKIADVPGKGGALDLFGVDEVVHVKR